MKVQITIKLAPESRGEIIDTFGAQYREFREVVEGYREKGAFGDPLKVNLRWLLESGRWENDQEAH